MRTPTEILAEIEKLQKEYAEQTNPLLNVSAVEDGWSVFSDICICKKYPELGAYASIMRFAGPVKEEYIYRIDDTLARGTEVYADDDFESLQDCIGALNNTLAKLKRRKYVSHVEVDILSVDDEGALKSLANYFVDVDPEWQKL